MIHTEQLSKIGEEITYEEGCLMSKNYNDKFPSHSVGHFIGKDIINKILSQEGCEGISFYKGINEEGDETLIATGVDSEGNNFGIVADRSIPPGSNYYWDWCKN